MSNDNQPEVAGGEELEQALDLAVQFPAGEPQPIAAVFPRLTGEDFYKYGPNVKDAEGNSLAGQPVPEDIRHEG
jgi:hypothetical protein